MGSSLQNSTVVGSLLSSEETLSCTTLTCWVRRDRHTTISEDRNYVTQLTDHWAQVESRHARWQFLPTLYPVALCPCWSRDPAINCVGEPFVFSLVFVLQVKCFGFEVYIFVSNWILWSFHSVAGFCGLFFVLFLLNRFVACTQLM